MKVVVGSASQRLAARVAKGLKCGLVRREIRRFPDGEFYIRLTSRVKGERVAVIQSTCHPQNDNLVELLLTLDAVRDLGAKRVTAVVPYLAYARQDKRFRPGEAVSFNTVLKLIRMAGADELVTVDVHEGEKIGGKGFPVENLTAMPLLGKFLGKMNLKDAVAMGGDQGSEERARAVAAEMGAEHDYLEKKRITPTKVLTKPKKLDVRGRDVVIVDDIISTGGTVVEAAKILRRQGARRVYAACTHGVLACDALGRLRAAGVKKIVATDTIERRESLVSVAPLVARALG